MTEPGRRGRPRSESIDTAILEAAIEELIAHGLVGLQMEAVAARAGVAKTTVYRRWPATSDLALAAVRYIKPLPVDPPEGTVREQLLWLLQRMRAQWGEPRYAALMRRIAADANTAPDLYRDGRTRLIGPHIEVMHRVLERAVADGLVAPDADLELLRMMMTSPITASALTLAPYPSAAQVERAVDTVLRGAAPR